MLNTNHISYNTEEHLSREKRKARWKEEARFKSNCFSACFSLLLGWDVVARSEREPGAGVPPPVPPDGEQLTRVLKVRERRRSFVYSIFFFKITFPPLSVGREG